MALMLPSHASSQRKPSKKPRTRALPATCLAILALFAASPQPAASQAAGDIEMPERLAVFLDCGSCDETFIRQGMTYVDYVRDRQVADVHVLVTQQNTGAGGEAQTFDLIGLGPFQAMDFSTVYTTSVSATEAEERDGFLRTLQALLVPYLMRTPMGERVRVEVDVPDEADTEQAQPADDPWNYWTIEVYADGSADFEAQQRAFDTRYGVCVNRVTED